MDNNDQIFLDLRNEADRILRNEADRILHERRNRDVMHYIKTITANSSKPEALVSPVPQPKTKPKNCVTCGSKFRVGSDKCPRCGTWRDGTTRPKGRGGAQVTT